ncbi:hypothetical protein [Leisingera sp.]|uniref:hypothetical protein n=1 Tax=Leisingera sp. TaxID=1879318 RepID=UPI003A90F5F2
MSLSFCDPKPRLQLPDLLRQSARAYRQAFHEVAVGATQERLKAGAFLKKVEAKIAGILKAKMTEPEPEKAGLEPIKEWSAPSELAHRYV